MSIDCTKSKKSKNIASPKIMKQNIHPKYYKNAIITCACGNTFKVGSTKREMHIEVCSACHPFYTGKAKVVDSHRRVDRFKRMLAKKEELQKGKKKNSSADRTSKSKSKTQSAKLKDK